MREKKESSPKGLPYEKNMNNIKFKKRTRLKDFSYNGYYRYFVTICTYNKIPIFTERDLIFNILKNLEKISEKHNFSVWAYCFMPDHLHLLLEGNDPNSDFKKFISEFKQITSFDYSKKFKKKLWQINYYEHILRKEEDTKTVVYYILDNPVRKGLVTYFKDYPFQGSYMFEL